MIREVDLASYLPPFMDEFKEIDVALKAENPEIMLVWKALDRVLQNEFIETADEYGISRFEKILNIMPSTEDTLESRRARVKSKWFNKIPYTIRVLLQKLKILCGNADFTLTHNFDSGYTIKLETTLEMFGQVREMERIIESIVPSNIVTHSNNVIFAEAQVQEYFSGMVGFNEIITIST